MNQSNDNEQFGQGKGIMLCAWTIGWYHDQAVVHMYCTDDG